MKPLEETSLGLPAGLGLFVATCLGIMPLSAQVGQPGAPPPNGVSLGLSFGGGWNSNPLESIRRVKGDVFVTHEISVGYRWTLWSGGALSLAASGASEFFHREHTESYNRGSVSAAISQNWLGVFGSVSVTQRKSMNRDLTRHDTASRELALGIGRTLTLSEGLTLNLFGRLARRILEDGTEDQFRASLNATLAYRSRNWILRVGGGYGYTLEDKTPLLPRINDRSVSARLGLAYEWAPDREAGLRLAFSRVYSSYAPNRYKVYSVSPQVSVTMRF